MDERTAMVTIGGVEYEMLLTTRATKQIAGRYGGLENLGEKLMKAENFEMALDEIVWLITLLCNQPILVHNLKHPEDKKPELTADEVELLTSPMELTDYKDAIMEAMYRGTKRNVEHGGRVSDEELFTRLLYYGMAHLSLSQDEVWLMPFGLLMDLWECHKQFMGIARPKQVLTIDDVIPYGI